MDGGGAEEPDERTSPFPYAEHFEEWVADETAAPENSRASRPPAPVDGEQTGVKSRGAMDEARTSKRYSSAPTDADTF